MSLTREILSPVTTAGLLYPALHQLISQIAMPNDMLGDSLNIGYHGCTSIVKEKSLHRRIFPTCCFDGVQTSIHNEGWDSSITFAKQVGQVAAVVQRISEGVEIPLDVTAYNSVNAVPYKIGHGYPCSNKSMSQNRDYEGNHRRFFTAHPTRPISSCSSASCEQSGPRLY